MEQKCFQYIPPINTTVPILVSVPHCGIAFPSDLKDHYQPDLAFPPDDTDFFVDQVYDFVSNLGIGMIKAHYSRWLIDLNRNAEGKALYQDGRVITQLCPTTNFNGQPIYKSPDLEPSPSEIERRINQYYRPYYQEIEKQLAKLKAKFGQVLFFDAHSIRHLVPGIQADPFPDFILGDNEGKSAAKNLSDKTLAILKKFSPNTTHNTPFKGGQLTRTFGQPQNGIHALQLEITKLQYMDDEELQFDESRADRLRAMLLELIQVLIEEMVIINQAA